MLTSVFYYNLYRPYIVGTNRNSENAPRRERINSNQNTDSGSRIFVLNKSLRNEIVDHAQNVTVGVTDLRQATGRAAHDMENFNRTVYREGWDQAIENLVDNLEDFADGFNQSAEFMQSQEHSAGLRAFSEEVTENVYYNRSRLELIGLSLSEDGRLSFSGNQVRGMSRDQINVAISENLQIFEGIRTYTSQILSEPLVEHMHFRGLTYHYNYQLGRMETEGFGLLEAGMLVDRLV